MKKIDIAGIPFSDEALNFLKEWLIPVTKVDSPQICHNITTVDKAQSFLLKHWDELDDDDLYVKNLLVGLQDLKENLSSLALNMKGGEA